MTWQADRWYEAPELKPGDRIVEKDAPALPKTVEEVVPGSHVIAKGLNRTRIAWRNLNRYRRYI